jgi:hypothetical protein
MSLIRENTPNQPVKAQKKTVQTTFVVVLRPSGVPMPWKQRVNAGNACKPERFSSFSGVEISVI